MSRPKTKAVMSFALRLETIEELNRVAAESGIVGGRSTIVEDAVSAWLRRYKESPSTWLVARGVPIQSEPTEGDDL